MKVQLKHLTVICQITERKIQNVSFTIMEIIRKTTPTGEPYIISYLHAKSAAKGNPVSVTMELTSRCNFNCKMCYIHTADCNKSKSEELTAAQWIEIGKQAKDAGAVFVLLTGGEPLIRSDFREIYTSLKRMGLVVSVNTNASLIDEEMMEFFKNDKPSRLNISLYGASEETYSSLCGGEYYTTVLNNIKKLKEIGVQTVINLSITPYNCRDIEKIIEIAKSLEINIRATTYMYPPIRRLNAITGENPARFSAEEAARIKAEYDLLYMGKEEFLKRADILKSGGAINYDACVDPTAEGENMKCRAGKSTCWINYKGQMSVCGMFGNEGYDVMKLGFASCWQKAKEERDKIKTPAECAGCKYKMVCPACAAVCKSEGGRFDKVPKYLCKFSETNLEYIFKLAEDLRK